jgi:Superfamily II RNA helicase
MRVSHSMLLNVIAREGDPFDSMRQLLRDNHEEPRNQARLSRRAIQIYRTLLSAGVVERLEPPDETGRTMRVTEDLQFGFALNQPLSTFALATFDVLDRESPTYALDMVSILEATLEDPRPVLSAQRFKARGEAVAQMKAEGIEYDERMELLEDITWPQPLLELLEATYELYRQGHPWIAETELSPKSVVRDMFERAMTFGEFVAFYGLTRSEGMVLRYLSDAYKALRQTVPDNAKTEELIDLIEWLGEVVRQTDSSLLDEWEQLTDPGDPSHATGEITPGSLAAQPKPITTNERAFRVLVRNAMFRRVQLASLRRWIDLGELDPDFGQDAWEDGIQAYFDEHD